MSFRNFGEVGAGALVKMLAALEAEGYNLDFESDFWPIVASHSTTSHVIRLRKITKPIALRDMNAVASHSNESRVLLADFAANPSEWIRFWPAYAQMAGIGIYDLNAGWVLFPGTVTPEGLQRLRQYQIPHYTTLETGEKLKVCTKCGEYKSVTEFYRKPRREYTARDPYRTRCKACFQ